MNVSRSSPVSCRARYLGVENPSDFQPGQPGRVWRNVSPAPLPILTYHRGDWAAQKTQDTDPRRGRVVEDIWSSGILEFLKVEMK